MKNTYYCILSGFGRLHYLLHLLQVPRYRTDFFASERIFVSLVAKLEMMMLVTIRSYVLKVVMTNL